MTAHEHQIWTWVENISVVNLEFDFPSFAELDHDNGLNRLIAALKVIKMLIQDCDKILIINIFDTSMLRRPCKSVRQRVFPSAATETIGRTIAPKLRIYVTLLHTELES